jgi:hypothetical protein
VVGDSDFQIYIRHGRPPWRPSIFQKPDRMITASGKWMAGTSPAMTAFYLREKGSFATWIVHTLAL